MAVQLGGKAEQKMFEEFSRSPHFYQRAEQARLLEIDRDQGSYFLFLDVIDHGVSCVVYQNPTERTWLGSGAFYDQLFRSTSSHEATLSFHTNPEGSGHRRALTLTLTNPLSITRDKSKTLSFKARISESGLRSAFGHENAVPSRLYDVNQRMMGRVDEDCASYIMDAL